MKPIFLKFCGINSYEEEFCIDFESLAAEGIFGIFGATGSGKSTILDAITLALYGKMPRHNKNTHSSFMNVALNTAYVEFIFEAALQGGGQRARFEIHRVYKRNSKGGVNISKSLLREVGGDILADRKESEVNAAIIANLGLNYEDFTRSVFLPQGKFNEFMFLDSRDRGKMLERLFDLEKFGEALKLRVNAVEARAEMAVEACALKISFYGDISQEKLSVKENLLAQTAAEVAHLADEKELFFAEREKYMALDAAYSQYLAARQERERHEARAARMESAAAALDAARAADALLKPINALKSLVSQHEQAKSSLSAMGQLAKTARQQAKMHDSEYQAAREAMETDFPALSEKEQQLNAHLERLFEIENAEREILDLRRKWKIEEGRLKQKRKHLEEGNAKIAEIKGILEDVSLRKLEASVDSEVLKMLIEAAGIEKDLYSKNHEIGALDGELSGHKGAVLDCSAALEAKQYLLSELFAKNQESLAGQLAQNLEDGLPCPVCGSLHHPAPANHTESLDDGADSERLRDEIEDIKARLNRARAMQEAAAETLAKLEHDRDGLANSLAAYQKSLSLENFDTALQAAFEKNTARAALEEHETALRAELESLETAQKSLLLEVSRHVSAQEATRAAGKDKVLAVEAKRAALGAFGGHEEATAQLENVQSQKLALVITRKESEDLRNKYQLDSLEFEKNLASLTERAHNLAEMRGQQQAAIDEKLAACGFDSIEVALGASLPREQMAALEAEIEDYQQKKAETASLLANLSKVLEDIDNPQNIPEIAGAA
ncbi:MAG: SMC family ATPase, partial [Clostridiales bacterium]|nr:SMC family ATPase [Clostridiales bacterium]